MTRGIYKMSYQIKKTIVIEIEPRLAIWLRRFLENENGNNNSCSDLIYEVLEHLPEEKEVC